MRESVSILFEVENLIEKVSNRFLFSSTLLLEHGNIVILLSDLFLVLDVLLFSLLDSLGHHISESNKVDDSLLILFSVSSEVLNFSSKGIDSIFGDVLFSFSFSLLSSNSILIVEKLVVGS